MNDAVFVVRDQQGLYWIKSGDWIDGREPQRVMKFAHRDEAVNQLVELSAKNTDLRGEVLSCEVNARGEPELEPSDVRTPLLAELAAEKARAARELEQEQQQQRAGEPGIDAPEPAGPGEVSETPA